MSQSSSPRPVEKEDLFRLKFIQAGKLSPDGKRAVYAVSHIGAKKEEEKEEEEFVTLWLVSLDTGEARQLTGGAAKDTAPAWSPDGRQIAFMSTRGEKPQIYVIPVDGGEARALTSLKQGVGGGPVWSPDGKHLAFTAGPQNDPPDPAKPYRVTRHVYRFDGIGYLDPAVQSLYVIAAEGGEPRQLTDDPHEHQSALVAGREANPVLRLTLPDTHRTFMPRLRVM
jgi:Tol biopolymer transport system component